MTTILGRLNAVLNQPLFGGQVEVLLAVKEHIIRLETFAEKVNVIRNSIIGTGQVNWSEHVYPLVAALNVLGFKGLDYPEARDNFGTLVERIHKAETERDEVLKVLRDVTGLPKCDSRCSSRLPSYGGEVDTRCDCGRAGMELLFEQAHAVLTKYKVES